MVILDKVYRQQEDTAFLRVLEEVRFGKVSKNTCDVLEEKVRETAVRRLQMFTEGKVHQTVKPTKLFR